MHPRDKEKKTFMTDCDNFYYEVMQFGLKKCWCNLLEIDGSDF